MNTTAIALLLCALQAPQARDSSVTPTAGTATVSGVVVNDEDPARPVRRAVVTLTGPGLTPSRGAISDDNGRFQIARLPAGRFTLTATRASFITSVYGAKRPGRPGTPIDVPDGGSVRDLVVRIWRGAAVAGVIRDENGLPAEGIAVNAIPARALADRTILTLTNSGVKTNARGEFRIFGLEPGSYVISAVPPASPTGGALTPLTDAQVDAALDALRRRATAGPGAKPPSTPVPAAQPVDYAPVHFPGSALLEQATPIALTAGQERAGLDFSLQRVTTSTVEGVISRPDGSPAAGATLQLRQASASGPFTSGEPRSINATAGADGRFRILRVTPGQYRLIARAQAGASAGAVLWASSAVTVGGADVGGIVISLEPGVTVTGRIRFQRASESSTTPLPDLAKLRVSVLSPALANLKPGTPISQLGFGTSAQVQADGTFTVPGLLPDVYRFGVAGFAPPWSPRSAMLGDRDLFDGPVDLTGLSGTVDVVLTDAGSELSGRLVTAAGAPMSDVFVIAFSADRRRWGADARRVRAVRPDVGGRFLFADLPPGDYFLGAAMDVDPGEWQDVSFLERLTAASLKVSIGEGEKKVQDIRVGGGR
jgi:hypothetical protein